MTGLPLQNKCIVITRAPADGKSMAKALEKLGARSILFPTLRIEATDDWRACDEALRHLTEYEWIIFSSHNSVQYFLRRLREKNGQKAMPKIAVLGARTRATLERFGFSAHFMPQKFNASTFLQEFRDRNPAGQRILLPVSDIARSELSDGLRDMGAHPHRIVVYKTVPDLRQDPGPIKMKIGAGQIDCIAFFSPSAFAYFARIMGGGIQDLLQGCVTTAAIGATTARAMLAGGVEPDIVPDQSTERSMITAIAAYYSKKNQMTRR